MRGSLGWLVLLCACALQEPPAPPAPAAAPIPRRSEASLELETGEVLRVHARRLTFELEGGRERQVEEAPLGGVQVLVRSAAGDHAVLCTDADGRAELPLGPILVQLSRRCEAEPGAAAALLAAGERAGLPCRVELLVEPRLDLARGLLAATTAHRLEVAFAALRLEEGRTEHLRTWLVEGRRPVGCALEVEGADGPLELRTGPHGRGAAWLGPALERGGDPVHVFECVRDLPPVQDELTAWGVGSLQGREFVPYPRRSVDRAGTAAWAGAAPGAGRVERRSGARELHLRPADPEEPVVARWTAPRSGEWRVAAQLRPLELPAAAEVVVALDGQDLFWRRLVPGGTEQECEFEGVLRIEAGGHLEVRVRRAHLGPARPIAVGLRFTVDAGPGEGQASRRQWATDARASSEFARDRWCARQATGAPDTHRAGDIPTAWASLQPDGTEEWLELEYALPVFPVRARIHETHNPGAVVRVEGRDLNGTWWVLWEGPPTPGVSAPRWLEVDLASTERPIQALRLEVASHRVGGWNEIDAVELLGEPEEPEAAPSLLPGEPPYPDEPPPHPVVPRRAGPDAGDGWSPWQPVAGPPGVEWRVRREGARPDGRAEHAWQVWNRTPVPLRLALELACEEPDGRRAERWEVALAPGERAEAPGQWTECRAIEALRAGAEPPPTPARLALELVAPDGRRVPVAIEPEQVLAARAQLARRQAQVRAECLEARVERAAAALDGPSRAGPWLRATLHPAPEGFMRRARAELSRRHGLELAHLSRAARRRLIELLERPPSLLRPPPGAPEWPAARDLLPHVRRLARSPRSSSPRRRPELDTVHALHAFHPWPAPELIEDGVWLAGRVEAGAERLHVVDGTPGELWLFRGEVALAMLEPGEEALIELPRAQSGLELLRLLYRRELRR